MCIVIFLSLNPLPKVNKAYYLVTQVEKLKQVSGLYEFQSDSSAYVVRAEEKSRDKKDTRRIRQNAKFLLQEWTLCR